MRPRTAHALRGPACSLCDIMKFGYLHQVRALISWGIDLESRDNSGRTPLLLCAFLEPTDWGVSIAMTLIENGANMAQTDCFERNALHYACIYERFKLVRILLKAVDFDLNQADHLGNTPLHYAAMSGNVAITQLLSQSLKKYRLSMAQRNHRGRAALDEALLHDHVTCSHLIQCELATKQNGSVIKDVRFADAVMNESSPPTRDRVLRPKTAASLTSRPYSSFSSHDEPVNSSQRLQHINIRKPKSCLTVNGFKVDEEVITCAPESDFRNTPEYVLRLVQMRRDTGASDTASLGDSTYRSNWTGSIITSQSQQMSTADDWRHQFQVLFQVYEHQCSPSWRTTKTLDPSGPEQDTQTPTLEEIDGDDKDKKSPRRQSLNSRNSNLADNGTRRRQTCARINKLKPNIDAGLESTIRPMSSKKRTTDR